MVVLKIFLPRPAWIIVLWSVVPSLALAQSYTKHTLTLKGKKRTYYLYIPKGLEKGKKYPGVIAYHGFESDPGGFRWLISPDKLAEEYKYILVYPGAENKSWNAGRGFGSRNKASDDLSFASALVDVVLARHPVDPKRVYAMGFSNGAQMVALMICRMPHKLAAGAMVSHTMNIEGCNPKLKVPVLMIHGAKDKLAPFAGGGKSKILSHKDSVEFFKKVNETGPEAKILVNKPTVRCKSYPGTKTEVVDCICFNDGHSWPGGKEFKTDIFGTTNKELDANRFIFDFFKKYSKPAPNRANGQAIPTGLKSLDPKSTAKAGAKPKADNARKKVATKPAEIELVEASVKLGKSSHRYFAHAPKMLEGRWEALVIGLGPESFNAIELARLFEARRYAIRNRWLFVFPKTIQSEMKYGSTDWLFRVAEHARVKFKVVQPHVYLLGFGSGGKAVQAAYCYDSSWVSAAALSGYAWQKTTCDPVPQVPMFLVTSKKDPLVSFWGDKAKNHLGFGELRKDILAKWQGNVFQKTLVKGKTYAIRQWLTHEGRLELLVMETEWGGHGMPGSTYPFPKSYGKTFSGAKALEEIMSFFLKHPHHEFGIIHGK